MHHPSPMRLQELLDEALPLGEARALKAHLDGCAACAREFAGLSAVASAFASAPRPRLGAAFDRRLLAALRPSPYAAYAAAAAAALCGVWTVGVGYAVAAYGHPSWAGLSATGESLAAAAARLGVLAAKLPLAPIASSLLRDADYSSLYRLTASAVIAAMTIIALGRPQAARARRNR